MTATKKILVVDDDDDLRAGLTAVLQRRGYQTLEAGDGREAREMIDEERPDLVILDMMMPHSGGFSVLEHFQGDTNAPQFIMMTANTGAKHRAYAQEIGVADYLIKPFPLDRLLDGVMKTLGESAVEEAATPTQKRIVADANSMRCKCPSCGARIKAPRSLYGQTRVCPGCANFFTVTHAAPDDEGPKLVFDN